MTKGAKVFTGSIAAGLLFLLLKKKAAPAPPIQHTITPSDGGGGAGTGLNPGCQGGNPATVTNIVIVPGVSVTYTTEIGTEMLTDTIVPGAAVKHIVTANSNFVITSDGTGVNGDNSSVNISVIQTDNNTVVFSGWILFHTPSSGLPPFEFTPC